MFLYFIAKMLTLDKLHKSLLTRNTIVLITYPFIAQGPVVVHVLSRMFGLKNK